MFDSTLKGNIETMRVIKKCDFKKKKGGPLKNVDQLRTLKMHENGHISYWDKEKMKGVIEVDASVYA